MSLIDNLDSEVVRLDDVAEKIFALSPKIARRKAALNTLPVPAFRLNGSRRGPLYVRRADLEALVRDRIESAARVHSRMASAGAV